MIILPETRRWPSSSTSIIVAWILNSTKKPSSSIPKYTIFEPQPNQFLDFSCWSKLYPYHPFDSKERFLNPFTYTLLPAELIASQEKLSFFYICVPCFCSEHVHCPIRHVFYSHIMIHTYRYIYIGWERKRNCVVGRKK